MGDVRITNATAEALTANASSDIRVTHVRAEILQSTIDAEPTTDVRLTNLFAESITANASADVRLTSIIVEALASDVRPGVVVDIEGVEWRFRLPTMRIRSSLNSRATLSGIIDILDGSTPPQVDDQIIVTEDGVRLFGGIIDANTHGAITADASKDLSINLSAVDFNSLPDRRYVPALQSSGGLTVKDVLTFLMTYLSPYGVTLDAAQPAGPTLAALDYSFVTVTDILDDLTAITGWLWEIDFFKVLRMYFPGTVAAPFSIVDGDGKALGDITVEPSQTDYANRIVARVGPNPQPDIEMQWFAPGGTDTFDLYTYIPASRHLGFVWYEDPPGGHSETLGDPGSGAQWIWQTGPQRITRAAGPVPVGIRIAMRYVVQYPITAVAEDLAEIAANGIYEKVIDHGNIWTVGNMAAEAATALTHYSPRKRNVRYVTKHSGLKVGQSQPITIARRGLAGTFLIIDLETSMYSTTRLLLRTVTLQESDRFQGSWQDTYKLWAATGIYTGPGASISGGGSAGPAYAPPPYFLGASAIEWVQANPVAWIPAGGIQFYPMSTSGTVNVRLRAMAGSVTARLWNITNGVAAGTSAPVTSTTFVTVSFPVTLTPGCIHELQLLPSLVSTDVQGIGYLQ